MRRQASKIDFDQEPLATWNLLEPVLTTIAAKFMAEQGRPLILVIDATDLMAKNDEKFTRGLQEFAKFNADEGNLHVVFFTSEEFTMPLMTNSPAVERWEV